MKSYKVRVSATLCVGMILERTYKQQTVTDRIVVTAIGKEMFLATDSEGKEHSFYHGKVDEYQMNGWSNDVVRGSALGY